MCRPRRPPPRPRPAPRLPFDPDGRPALSFTRASQCGTRRRMLRPRPRRRRCDARGAQPPPRQMAQGFQGSLNQCATGMLSRRSPASARRCVPRSGRAASHSAAVDNARDATARADRADGERTASPYGLESKARRARDFRCGVAVSGPMPCLRRPGEVRGLQEASPAKTGKPTKPRSELCREDAEPPNSTPWAS